uniref:Uncharacterized protein n=1 Tax=Heterorhabditis bacteriophora TaxID=37862 RepID=A0A1I7WCC1_HETBA
MSFSRRNPKANILLIELQFVYYGNKMTILEKKLELLHAANKFRCA